MKQEIEKPLVGRQAGRVSRRALLKGTRHVLKELDREVERALGQFVKENRDLVDEDTRSRIRELRHDFHQDLRSAFRSGLGGHRSDLEAVSADVQQAFAKLIGGLQTLATRLQGDAPAPPQRPEDPGVNAQAARSIIPAGTDGVVVAGRTPGAITYSEARTAQVKAATRTDGSSLVNGAFFSVAVAVQVSFNVSFSSLVTSTENTGQSLSDRLGNILAEFSDNLTALLANLQEGGNDAAGFLSDLGAALDKLAGELQDLLDRNPTSAPVDRPADRPQALPLRPQVLPYDPVVAERPLATDSLEATA